MSEVFPDASIIHLIQEELEGLLDLKQISFEKGYHEVFNFNFCELIFQVEQTFLKVSVVERPNFNSYGLTVMISRGRYQYIIFDDYLNFIGSDELKVLKSNESLDNYSVIKTQLELLRKYLSSDLKSIFTEGDWIEVPFERY